LNILAGGQIDEAAGFETVPPLIEQDAGAAVQEVNEILVGARVAVALAIVLERNQHLRKAGAHRGRDQDVADSLLPARQLTGHKPAGCQQRVQVFNDAACETK
jgi:hypothetical protein